MFICAAGCLCAQQLGLYRSLHVLLSPARLLQRHLEAGLLAHLLLHVHVNLLHKHVPLRRLAATLTRLAPTHHRRVIVPASSIVVSSLVHRFRHHHAIHTFL